jgi:multiple sugar transport system substrate-binding protein
VIDPAERSWVIGSAERSRRTVPRAGAAVLAAFSVRGILLARCVLLARAAHPARTALLARVALIALTVVCLATGCARSSGPDVLRFWAMGREGEVVTELIRDFESENPDIRVDVQQLPWSAAHEKLLTAFVGRSTPDLAQLGNTWISEFAAIRALQPLPPRPAAPASAATAPDSTGFFRGIWRTNLVDGVCYGIPWYVDTRVLFYRKDILAAAGYDSIPATWEGWRAAMQAIRRHGGADRYAIFLPINEWLAPVVLGLQAGSTLLADEATHGAFRGAEFRRAFDFLLGLYRDGLAPPVSNNEIANMYQEFARGYFAMHITGPWNLGEFRRRLPPELQDAWGTAPLPGPTPGVPGVSTAGGSSLVLFRESKHQEAAWRLVTYLSRPDVQLRFFELTGDLPARTEAWTDPRLASDPKLAAFGRQLQNVTPTPKIPEWELIATRVQERVELAVRGALSPDSALALLDRDAEQILAKRRWMMEKDRTRVATTVRP